MSNAWAAAPQSDAVTRAMAHDIFKQLIEINTTDSIGSTTVAAQAMAKRLLDAAFRGGRCRRHRTQRAQGKYGCPLSWQARLEAAADPDHRAPGCGGGAARGLEHRSSSNSLLNRTGTTTVRGTQDMKEADAIAVTDFIRLKERRLRPEARHHSGAYQPTKRAASRTAWSWLLQNFIAISSMPNWL